MILTLTEYIRHNLVLTSSPEIPCLSLLYQTYYPTVFSLLIWNFEEVLPEISYKAITK